MPDSDNYDMEVKINKSDIESNIDVNIDLEGTSKICPICGVILFEEYELAKARSEKTTHYPNGSTIKFSYTTIPNTYKWIDRTKEQVSVKNVYLNKEGNLVKIKKD